MDNPVRGAGAPPGGFEPQTLWLQSAFSLWEGAPPGRLTLSEAIEVDAEERGQPGAGASDRGQLGPPARLQFLPLVSPLSQTR